MSQTPDIVERLRESGSQDCMRGEPWRSQVKDEAADTITQLRERLDAVEKERDQLRLSNERLRERAAAVVKDIDALVENSSGVIGLHLNGDEAPWTDLLAGGKYEDWLVSVELLNAALTAESGTEVGP